MNSRKTRSLPCAIAVLLFIASSSFSYASTKIKVNRVNTDDFPRIKALVGVEENGVVVGETSADSYAVAVEGGMDASVSQVETLRNSDETLAMAIAIDTSGSMKKQHLDAIKRAVENLIGEKKEQDVAAIISFNDQVFLNCPFTSDSSRLLESLDSLEAGGRITVLFEAVFEGLGMLEDYPGPAAFHCLIVLSDGKDEGTGFTLESQVAKAKSARIPVYSLGFLNKKQEHKYLGNMKALGTRTGGRYQKVDDADQIVQAYKNVADRIFKQQVLAIETGFAGDGKDYSLEIGYTGLDGISTKDSIVFRAPLLRVSPRQVPEENMEGDATQEVENAEGTPSEEAKPGEADEPVEDEQGGEDGNASEESEESGEDGETEEGLSDKKLLAGLAVASSVFMFLLFYLIVRSRRKRRESRRSALDIRSFDEPVDQGGVREASSGHGDGYSKTVLSDTPHSKPVMPSWHLHCSNPATKFPLSGGSMTVGAYEDNALVLDSDTVSGYHAELTGKGSEWYIKDLGSTNGTYVNGRRIVGPTRLRLRDQITLGPFYLTVVGD